MSEHLTTILHQDQRYKTCGDWRYDAAGNLHITASFMDNPRYEMLVKIHELVEAFLCGEAGVSQAQVDAFDIEFEAKRKPGDLSEPGDSKEAPYRRQHEAATTVEKIVCAEAGIAWDDYERTVNAL